MCRRCCFWRIVDWHHLQSNWTIISCTALIEIGTVKKYPNFHFLSHFSYDKKNQQCYHFGTLFIYPHCCCCYYCSLNSCKQFLTSCLQWHQIQSSHLCIDYFEHDGLGMSDILRTMQGIVRQTSLCNTEIFSISHDHSDYLLEKW